MAGLSFDFLIRDKGSDTLKKVDKAADKTHKTFGRLSSSVGSGAAKMTAGIGGLGKGFLGLTAAVAGAAGVLKFGGDAIAEAREAAKVGKLTANVIKVTGGAAKVTAGQVGALAESISNKAGVDDEVIQTGANLLLTFKNVRNEAGKGSDVFNRATQAAVDLSAAGFGSVDGAAKMLGKALNDPLKGISALGRAGVTFSDAQKKQIKTMVETGNVLGAQKIIMKEVESQVGGAAAAMADPADKAKVAWGNFKEAIGTGLLPILSTVLNAFTGMLPPIQKTAGVIAGKLQPVFKTIGIGVSAFFAALKEGDVTSDGFVGAMETVGDFLHRLWGTFQRLWPTIKQVGATLLEVGKTAAPIVGKAFQIAGEVIGKLAATVFPILKQVMATVVGAFKKAAPDIMSAMASIREIVLTVIAIIQAAWQRFGPTILAVVKIVFGTIFKVIGGVLKAVVGIVKTVLAVLRGDWSGAWNAIKQVVAGIWSAIKALVSGALAALKTIVKVPLDWIKKTWESIWNSVKSFVGGVWSGIKTTVQDAIRYVVGKFLGFGQTILDTAARMFGWVPGMGPKLKAAAAEFRTFRNAVNDALGGIDNRTISLHAKLGLQPASSRVILEKGRAAGGRIPGAPSSRDNRLMPVATGEYVVNAKETAKNLPFLEALNSGQVRGFAAGGLNVATSFAGADTIGPKALAAMQKAAQANMSKLFGDIEIASAGGYGGYKGGRGVERWRGVALQALALAGSPLSWIGSLLRRMNQESGGNPRAINLWDSNARAGIPSKGLMQTIDPTFNAYAGKLRGRGVWDPLANIYASIRYANDRYGSAPRGWNRSGGYDRGGLLMPGWTMAYNGTGRPEVVTPPGAGRSGGVNVYVTVQGGVYGDKRQAGREIADAIASFVSGGGKVTVSR